MPWRAYPLAFVLAYLMGSLPIGYLAVRLRRGIDIRQIGSGHTGGTNVLRTAGPVAGGVTVVAIAARDTLR